jgi:hypothetical protein
VKSRSFSLLILGAALISPLVGHAQSEAQGEDPGKRPYSEFDEGRRKAQIDVILLGRPATRAEYAEAEHKVAADNGRHLLASKESEGWSYAEVGGHRGMEIGADFSNNAGGESKFVIVYKLRSHLDTPPSSGPNQFPKNLIRMEADPRWRGVDLGPFFAANNRLLLDFPVFETAARSAADNGADFLSSSPSAVQAVRQKLSAYSNDALAITIADLGAKKSAITIFGLKESAEAGGLRGDMFIIDKDMNNLEFLLQGKLGSQSFSFENPAAERIVKEISSRLTPGYKLDGPVKRVFVYGSGDFLPKIVESCGGGNCEVVRRARQVEDLYALNTKLEILSRDKVLKNGFLVVNGIPEDERSFSSMGSFEGNHEDWLSYRDAISGLMANYRHVETTSWESLTAELTEGESDVLFLFAHSNGSADFFLGGHRVSLKDMEALPDRSQEQRRRPRLAVLFSCNTGRDPKTRWSLLDWRDGTEVDQLAQILVRKGFVDKVLAPNHAFGPEEGIRVLQSLLQGDNRPLGVDGWVNWAFEPKKFRGPEA